jgi:hypothetical protein
VRPHFYLSIWLDSSTLHLELLVLSIVFSVIVLGLAAYLQSLANGIALNFVDLAIASAVITIVTLPVL